MTPALLDDLVRAAACEVLAARGLDAGALPPDPGVGCPGDPARGEYATPVALRTAGRAGVEPRALAGWMADVLAARPEVAAVDVVGPGFLALWMTPAGRSALVVEALTGHLDGAALRSAADELGRGLPREIADVEGARYALLRSPAGVLPDGVPVTRRVPENPLHRVQYAHARLVALAGNAADLGVAVGPVPAVLVDPAEVELVGCLAAVPAAARTGEPHRLARRLEALAAAVPAVQESALPRGDEDVTDLHRARLALLAAARRLLGAGLRLLGVSAPDRI